MFRQLARSACGRYQMDLRSIQKPLKGAIPQRSGKLANHAESEERSNRDAHFLLGRYWSRGVSGRSAQRRRRCGDGCVFGRSAAGSIGGMRANYLSDGRHGDGHCHRTHRGQRRRRHGSARHARNRERRCRLAFRRFVFDSTSAHRRPRPSSCAHSRRRPSNTAWSCRRY